MVLVLYDRILCRLLHSCDLAIELLWHLFGGLDFMETRFHFTLCHTTSVRTNAFQ